MSRLKCTEMKDAKGRKIYEGNLLKEYRGYSTDGKLLDTTYQVMYGIAEIEDNEMYSSNTVCGFYLKVVGSVFEEDIGNLYHMDNISKKELCHDLRDQKTKSK